jgi:hypothetical protein
VVLSELRTYTLGVDLGQSHDPTALALIETARVTHDSRDPITYNFKTEIRLRLMHLERVPLGLPYPEIVRIVKRFVETPALAKNCTLAVDATGVGAPIVDLLKRAELGCRVIPVTITPGDNETNGGAGYRVPKRDLIAGLQVLFGDERFSIPRTLSGAESLIAELAGMRMSITHSGHDRYNGPKDDLVLALALAWWWARKNIR